MQKITTNQELKPEEYYKNTFKLIFTCLYLFA